MELVIRLSDKEYSELRSASYYNFDKYTAYLALKNGTPLPEHHGRLIDADWVKNTLDIYVINEYNGQFIRRNDIDSVPTIIEGSDSE